MCRCVQVFAEVVCAGWGGWGSELFVRAVTADGVTENSVDGPPY